jgi:hypothetical protein
MIRALRLLAAFVIVGGTFVLIRTYSAYQNIAVSEPMEVVVRRITSLQYQVDGFERLLQGARRARENSRTPKERLQRLYAIEEGYVKTARGLVEAIDDPKTTTAMQSIFRPGDKMPTQLKELRDWLSTEQGEEHPLLSIDQSVDRKLAALATHFAMYRECLRIGKRDFGYLRTDIDGCIGARQKGLEPLP